MAREGQDKLSIRKLAAQIEYSPGTIYLHFIDKDEIIYELMQMGFQLMTQTMSEQLIISDPLTRVRAIGEAYISFGLNYPDWYDLMFNSANPIKHLERCQSEWGHGFQLFEALVQNCQEIIEKYALPASSSRVLALMLWGTAHGLVNLSEVLVDGENIYAPGVDVTDVRTRIGMLAQKPFPLPMSIYDNVAYGMKIHGLKKGKDLDRAVRHYLEMAGNVLSCGSANCENQKGCVSV